MIGESAVVERRQNLYTKKVEALYALVERQTFTECK